MRVRISISSAASGGGNVSSVSFSSSDRYLSSNVSCLKNRFHALKSSRVEVAKAQLSDGRRRSVLHAMKEIDEVSVKIVIHLKGMHLRLSEQNTSAAAEYVHKSAVFHRKNSV